MKWTFKKKCIIGASMIITITINGREIYTIQKGDTLSNVLSKIYPKHNVYGKTGSLKKILLLNPQIKNPNRVFINQTILLEDQTIEIKNETDSTTPPTVIVEKFINTQEKNIESEKNILAAQNDQFTFSILYGGRFISHRETGVLGKSNIGNLFLNNLKLNTEFVFDDYRLGLRLESYKFKYSYLNSTDSKNIYSLELNTAYKWMTASLLMDQGILFRNKVNSVELAKTSILFASLGAFKEYSLATKKPTFIKIEGQVLYPLSHFSESKQIETNSISGYGLKAGVGITRLMVAKEDYSISFKWLTELKYKNIKQSIVWDASIGDTQIETMHVSSGMGVEFNF